MKDFLTELLTMAVCFVGFLAVAVLVLIWLGATELGTVVRLVEAAWSALP